MAAHRRVNTALLESLVQGSKDQTVGQGSPLSIDSNFPVFRTPVNEDVIVYIPRVGVKVTENGEIMDALTAYVHDGRIGNHYVSLRCVHGLTGNPAYDELGYDGNCPACEGSQDAWKLYKLKLENAAKRIGVDPQNDTNEVLKPVRETILREMDLKNAEEYIIFPIVVIPVKARFTPADNALEGMKTYFVSWRKRRYQDSLIGALDSLLVNPGHPAGLFWHWKFSYDTKGKQPNARDSAKNAKYTPITDSQILTLFEPLRHVAEERAKEFTPRKAAEVVVAAQFLYKEDLEAEVNKILAKTRQMLDLAETSGVNALNPATETPTVGTNPLLNFGVDQNPAQPQAQPQPQPQAQGNPISFS